jgi:magnesium chelatase subunit D
MRELSKDKKIKPLLVVISDGRGNVPCLTDKPMDDMRTMAARIAEEGYPSVVIDSETSFLKLGLAQRLSDSMRSKYIKLDDLRAESLTDAIASLSEDLR